MHLLEPKTTELVACAPTPLDVSLERLRTLTSPLTGVVARVGETLRMTDDARMVKVGASLADQAALVGMELSNHAGGASHDRSAAVAAAIGEAVERYAASYLPTERICTGSAREVAGAIDPGRFALFADEQYRHPAFPFERFTADTRLGWIDGLALPGGAPVRVPAQLVFMSFEVATLLGEPRIGYTTSNGLACGPSREEAILNALCEALERDAFVLTWENRLSLPLLDWRGHAELTRYASRYFDPSGLSFGAVDLSVFWNVPTVLGVVRNAGEGATLGVGASCAPTIEAAWRTALKEAFAVHAWARTEHFESPPRTFEADFSDLTDFVDHIVLHSDPANRDVAAFLDASTATRHTRDVPQIPSGTAFDSIAAICERLAEKGLSAYAVDVTTVDIRQAGLHVWKVVVPELCALNATHVARFCGGRRLYHAAHDLGLVERPLTFAELNHYPHPFP